MDKRRKRETDSQMLNQSRKKEESYLILIILMVIFRLVISLMEPYAIDMGGYLAWSRYLANNGPFGLYSRFHIVYAPFYQYFLWISGLIARFLGLSAFFIPFLSSCGLCSSKALAPSPYSGWQNVPAAGHRLFGCFILSVESWHTYELLCLGPV